MLSKSFGDLLERVKRLIGRGSAWFIVLFLTLTVVANFLVSFVVTLITTHAKGPFFETLVHEWWYTTNLTFFDGFGPSHFWGRVFVPITLLFFYAIPSIIFSFVNSLLMRFQENMRRGKSPITNSGHTLILGWSDRIFSIISELDVANANQKGSVIAIFSSLGAVDMDDTLKSRLGEIKHTKLITRHGDPTNIYDLRRANVSGARNIIILDEESDSDASVISTILAIQAIDPTSKVPIVAEMDSDLYSEAMRSSSDRSISFIRSEQIITRVTVQSARSAGMTPVLLDLLDFDGDEIYFSEVKELAGKTYGDALTAFHKASVMGLVRNDGQIVINPPAHNVIGHGDKIIAIAADDDQIIFSGLNVDLDSLKVLREDRALLATGEPQNVLFIGWSNMGEEIIKEITPFLPTGSHIEIIADPKLIDFSITATGVYPGLTVNISEAPQSLSKLTEYLIARKYDKAIVLAYRGSVAFNDADARTLATILLLNRFYSQKEDGTKPPRIIAEILNSVNLELTEVASADDLVVSDNLAALLIAQLSENPDLLPIFEELFDKDGSPININSIDRYVEVGTTISFAELVARAASFGESAIGYRIDVDHREDATAGVRLNPEKSSTFVTSPGDGLIVIA
jgi:K+/H+ antiporter YhaU regulatory subunit KhtT